MIGFCQVLFGVCVCVWVCVFLCCDAAQSSRKTELNLLGCLLLVWPSASVCTTGGHSRGGGRLRTPRYQGPLGCFTKRAGRPMGYSATL